MRRTQAVSKQRKLAPLWSYEFKVINKLNKHSCIAFRASSSLCSYTCVWGDSNTDTELRNLLHPRVYGIDTQVAQQYILHSANLFCLLQNIRFTLLVVSIDDILFKYEFQLQNHPSKCLLSNFDKGGTKNWRNSSHTEGSNTQSPLIPLEYIYPAAFHKATSEPCWLCCCSQPFSDDSISKSS